MMAFSEMLTEEGRLIRNMIILSVHWGSGLNKRRKELS